MMNKYGTGQDHDCYPGSNILVNHLNIQDGVRLEQAERDITALTAVEINFSPPPYDLLYLQKIHQILFQDIYPWAGSIRVIDISKGDTRFCSYNRIAPEAHKIFSGLSDQNYLFHLNREELIVALAEIYGDLNMIHPFREGNGRALRILFEHLIAHCGWKLSWAGINKEEWIDANILSVYCDYSGLESIFSQCIQGRI